jgi:hypothetical protein
MPCTEQLFIDTLVSFLSAQGVPTNVSTYGLCRYGAMFDAVAARATVLLQNVGGCCGGEPYCCEDGEWQGQAAALFYCNFQIATQGAFNPADYSRPAVDWCGFLFETCCDRVYAVDTYYFEPNQYPCREYRAEPHFFKYDAYRAKACARHP